MWIVSVSPLFSFIAALSSVSVSLLLLPKSVRLLHTTGILYPVCMCYINTSIPVTDLPPTFLFTVPCFECSPNKLYWN
jgi:hypothetical protein